MFKVKNKDNKTEVSFTSKDYPSQLFFQYKKLPLQKLPLFVSIITAGIFRSLLKNH